MASKSEKKQIDRSESRTTPEPAHAEQGDRESKSKARRRGEQEEEHEEFKRGEEQERIERHKRSEKKERDREA